MSGNSQRQLRQVRKDRVHISLDVQATGAARKELPFVIGVLGDFAGTDEEVRDANGKVLRRELDSFADRPFVSIDSDNFDGVMEKMLPALTLDVDNKLSADGGAVAVNLVFRKLEDFNPESVAAQVPQIAALLAARSRLRDLASKADLSEKLEVLLEELLDDENKTRSISQLLGPVKE